MMTNLIARAWQSVKPHVPLIRFRKGSLAGHEGSSVVHAAPGVAQPQAAPSSANPGFKTVQSPLLEDWQLPAKYRRQPISQQELDYINRGGPE